ncbi:RES family NAD+ phosphorylase [Chitinophaga sp. NPDC101104]|uniref:RES family NAD+ phosphorylase n=1 Tax=Chitinophaga sp. NPDC101104 TaxID=3390561 RepID=UPI003CFBC6DF
MTLFMLNRSAGSVDLLRRVNYAGYWNHAGVPCRYAVGQSSQCLLEKEMVKRFRMIPKDAKIIVLDVPDGSIEYFPEEELPDGWDDVRVRLVARDFGTARLRKTKKLLLAFPSISLHREWIYVINITHPLAKQIRVLDYYPAIRQPGQTRQARIFS